MFRHIITLLMFCCLSFQLNAQEVALKADHPDQHVVVKGDTLWGISAKFLKDPWQWPKVWKLNRAQIKNPHLIYPGDVVMLDMSSGSPELKLLRETITLEPGAVEEPSNKSAISTIPLNVIAPFISQPLVIEKDELATSPRIIAAPDDRVLITTGSRFYINKIEEGDHLKWFIYRPGENLIDPDTKEVLGTEAVYLGDATITRYGEPATAVMTKVKEEIFTKDRLVPSNEDAITSFVPHAPDDQLAGRILKIYGGLAEAGPQSIISMNLGLTNGVEVGHVFAINRFGRIIKDPEPPEEKDKKKEEPSDEASDSAEAKKPQLEPGMIKLPDERIGLVMVFRVFDKIAYGLVMQASGPIYTSDVVQTP